MKKLKVLLVASLLSLAPVSFASTLSVGDYAGDSITTIGTIILDSTNDVVDNVNGAYTAAGEKDLWAVDLQLDATVLSVGDITYGNLDPILEYRMFSDEDLLNQVGGTGINHLTVDSLTAGIYYLELTSGGAGTYNVHVSAVPVPAAGILFASALFGAGIFGRRKKKAKTSVVGAFARAS